MSPETVAIAKCEGSDCGKDVAVKKNRSGLAYYRCDHCGREMKHHWQRKSDAYLASLGAPAPKVDQAPAAVVKTKPAPAPVASPAPAPVPAATKKTASTFFS